MTRIIEVLIAPNGDTTIQTKGYTGSECLLASKFLETALGIVADDRKTSEFFQATTTQPAPLQQ